MRRSDRIAVLILAAGLASACRPDEVITTENIPTAGVRFINAVPDSSGAFGFTLRFVDIVENNVQFRVTFRNNPQTTAGVTASAVTQFFPARAGSRHFRIFLDDTLPAITATVVKDTTVSLEAGKNYTAILWGEGRLGTMKLDVRPRCAVGPGAAGGVARDQYHGQSDRRAPIRQQRGGSGLTDMGECSSV